MAPRCLQRDSRRTRRRIIVRDVFIFKECDVSGRGRQEAYFFTKLLYAEILLRGMGIRKGRMEGELRFFWIANLDFYAGDILHSAGPAKSRHACLSTRQFPFHIW